MQLKLSKTAKPGFCPAKRCKERTVGGALCARHAVEAPTEDPAPATLGAALLAPSPSTQNEIQRESATAGEALDLIRGMVIVSNDDMDLANGLLRGAKDKIRALEAKRTNVTGPLNKALRELNSWFKPVIESYHQAEVILKSKISDALRATQAAQDEALARVAAAGGAEDADVLAVAHGGSLIEQPDNISVRTVWKFEIVDANLVPREFCCPDTQKIGALVADTCGAAVIPGVRAYSEDVVISRSNHKPRCY